MPAPPKSVFQSALADMYPRTDADGYVLHSPGQQRISGRRVHRTTKRRKGLNGDEVMLKEFRAWIASMNPIGQQ